MGRGGGGTQKAVRSHRGGVGALRVETDGEWGGRQRDTAYSRFQTPRHFSHEYFSVCLKGMQ